MGQMLWRNVGQMLYFVALLARYDEPRTYTSFGG